MKLVPTVLAALAMLLSVCRGFAGEGPQNRRIVLLSLAPYGSAASSREERFARELALLGGDYTVVAVPLAEPRLSSLGLDAQLGLLRPLLERHMAVVAIWLDESRASAVSLYFLVSAQGNAFVRVVEGSFGPSAERELAVAAAELLGSAATAPQEPKPEQRTLQPTAPESEVKAPPQRLPSAAAQAAAPAEAISPKAARLPTAISASFAVDAGLVGQVGRSLLAGARAGLDVPIVSSFYGRAYFAAQGGPGGGRDAEVTLARVFSLGIGASLLAGHGRFRLGPACSAELRFGRFDIETSAKGEQRFATTEARIGLGLAAQVVAAKHLAFQADLGIAISPQPDVFELESSGKVELATPYLSGAADIGAALLF